MHKRAETIKLVVNIVIVIVVLAMGVGLTLQRTKLKQQRATIELQRNILNSNDCYWTGNKR